MDLAIETVKKTILLVESNKILKNETKEILKKNLKCIEDNNTSIFLKEFRINRLNDILAKKFLNKKNKIEMKTKFIDLVESFKEMNNRKSPYNVGYNDVNSYENQIRETNNSFCRMMIGIQNITPVHEKIIIDKIDKEYDMIIAKINKDYENNLLELEKKKTEYELLKQKC